MKVFRIVTLATVLLATAGVSSASATMWYSETLPQSIWFSGATSWNNHIIQTGGLGFPGGKYGPVASTLRLAPFTPTANLRPLPSARYGEAVVTGQDGKVYAFGGLNANNALLGSTVALDPSASSNAWLAKDPLPIPRVALSATVASNGLIYTLGGDRAVSGGKLAPSAVDEIYNPQTNVWSTGPALPKVLDDTAAATSGTNIYVFGGYSTDPQDPGPSASAYSLDTSNPGAHWVQIPNMPSAADLPSAATDPTSANGDMYVAGGAIGSTGLKRVDVFDPTQGLWTCIKPMPQSRVGAPAAMVPHMFNEQLAVSGGLYGNTVENSVYYTTTGLNTGDGVPPTVTAAPVPHIVSGVQATTTHVETELLWTRADSATDILADNLQVHTSTGWTDVGTPWATLDPGYVFFENNNYLQYGVHPTDCNNNAAPLTPGPAFSTRLYTEGALHYAGSWPSYALSSAQGGHYRASTQTGAVATYKFTGARDIGWVAVKGPSRGVAYVSINGVRVATLSLYAKALQPREVVWHHAYGAFTNGTLTIKVAGTKGHPSVDVDSLYVIARPIGSLGPIKHGLAASHLAALGHLTAAPAKRVARP